MPRLEFFILSHSFSVDQFTDRLSIFDVLTSLHPRRFPAYVPKVAILSEWEFSEDELGKDFQLTIVINRPKPLERIPESKERFEHNFSGQVGIGRLFPTFTNVPFEVPGKHVFKLLLNGKHVAEHHIFVEEADNEAADDGCLFYRSKKDRPTGVIDEGNNEPPQNKPIVKRSKSK